MNGWTILDGVDDTLRLDRKNTCVFDASPKGSDLIWLSVNHANAQLGKHDGVSAPEVLGGRTGLEISRARNAQPRYAAEHCSTGVSVLTKENQKAACCAGPGHLRLDFSGTILGRWARPPVGHIGSA